MTSLLRLLLSLAACLILATVGIAAPAKPKAAKTARPVVKRAAADDKFMFIAYGDTRSYPDDHRKVISEIVRLHPEFVLQSGDLVARGAKAEDWAEFADITKPLREARIAYYPARGNHDVGPFYPQYVTEPFDSGNKFYYAFTRHRNRFIILDSMDPDEFAPDSAQHQWLEAELAKAQKTAVNTFVMFHEGPFSVGPHGPTPDAQKYLHPLFVKYKPRVVFCGHDHLYYHTTRDGVTYLVTGGGGAPLYPAERAPVLAVPGDVYASVHHVIRCDVDGPRVTFSVLALDRDTNIKTPWAKTDMPVTTVTTQMPGGPRAIQIPPAAGGAVIDRFTLGPK